MLLGRGFNLLDITAWLSSNIQFESAGLSTRLSVTQIVASVG